MEFYRECCVFLSLWMLHRACTHSPYVLFFVVHKHAIRMKVSWHSFVKFEQKHRCRLTVCWYHLGEGDCERNEALSVGGGLREVQERARHARVHEEIHPPNVTTAARKAHFSSSGLSRVVSAQPIRRYDMVCKDVYQKRNRQGEWNCLWMQDNTLKLRHQWLCAEHCRLIRSVLRSSKANVHRGEMTQDDGTHHLCVKCIATQGVFSKGCQKSGPSIHHQQLHDQGKGPTLRPQPPKFGYIIGEMDVSSDIQLILLLPLTGSIRQYQKQKLCEIDVTTLHAWMRCIIVKAAHIISY